jgi:hypothetical protein
MKRSTSQADVIAALALFGDGEQSPIEDALAHTQKILSNLALYDDGTLTPEQEQAVHFAVRRVRDLTGALRELLKVLYPDHPIDEKPKDGNE